MNKYFKHRLVIIIFATFTISCSPVKVESPKSVIYYSSTHLNGARTYVPMKEPQILKMKKKTVQSKRLSYLVTSIVKSKCSGGPLRDSMMILIRNNFGSIGIHQDKTVTINNQLCSVSPHKIDEIVKLTGLHVRRYFGQ